jgi:hypothetical protein
VAIVSYPFNKKARIPDIGQNGKWKDLMTWKERRCPNLQKAIQLKRESHLLNGSNFVVIGQPNSSTLKTYTQIALN